MTDQVRISIIGENPTETEHYRLEREATVLKQAGDWPGAIECLMRTQAIRGPLNATTRLAKFLQQAGRYEEAMQEIQRLIDGSLAWADGNFGHQPRSTRRRQQASWLARTHDDAALICKREKRKDLQAHHEAEAERWWAITRQLDAVTEYDKQKIREPQES